MTREHLTVLHVVPRAGSRADWNEHCLTATRRHSTTIRRARPLTGLRRTLHRQSFDVVHVHTVLAAAAVLVLLWGRRETRGRVVLTLHEHPRSLRLSERLLLRLVVPVVPAVVLCSASAHAGLPSSLRFLGRKTMTVVQSGVDLDRVDRTLAETSSGSDDGTFTVVSVGRLTPVRNPGAVLRAVAGVGDPTPHLVFVGAGELSGELQDQAEHLGLQGLASFEGPLDREEVYRRLVQSDLFVSASRAESLPVAVLEAMSCRVPVLLSDIPAHREVIGDRTDLVTFVDPDDIEGMAAEIRRYRDMPADQRERLGWECRQLVVERFGIESMAAGYEQVYRRTSDEAPRKAVPVARSTKRSAAADPAPAPEDVAGLLSAVLRRWPVVLGMALAGALLAFGAAGQVQPRYESTSSLVVGSALTTDGVEQQALQASASVALTYADLATRRPVLEAAAQEVGLPGWRQLRPMVRAEVPPNNPQLVEVIAEAESPAQARDIAAAVATQLAALAPTRAEPGSADAGFVETRLATIEQDTAAAQERLAALRGQRDAATTTEDADRFQAQIEALERQVGAWEDNYVALRALLPERADTNALSLLEEAVVPLDPAWPSVPLWTLVGAVLGGGIGVIVAHAGTGRRRRRRQPAATSPPPVPRAARESRPTPATDDVRSYR